MGLLLYQAELPRAKIAGGACFGKLRRQPKR